jgi:hypothetical protein
MSRRFRVWWTLFLLRTEDDYGEAISCEPPPSGVRVSGWFDFAL